MVQLYRWCVGALVRMVQLYRGKRCLCPVLQYDLRHILLLGVDTYAGCVRKGTEIFFSGGGGYDFFKLLK